MNLDNAELRAAFKRLFNACSVNTVEVTVRRRDIEILVLAFRGKHGIPDKPNLHPEQR